MRNPPKSIHLYLCGEKINRFSLGALLHTLKRIKHGNNLEVRTLSHQKGALQISEKFEHSGAIKIIGFSLLSSQWNNLRQNVNRVMHKKPQDVILIAGGPHPTAEPHELIDAGFDIVFIGEGENSLLHFMKTIQSGNNWNDTPGIVYKDVTGRYIHNPLPPLVEIDDCSTTSPEHKLTGSIEITRGCFYRCAYCQTPRIFGSQPRHRLQNSIIEEAEKNLRYIKFITPNALSYGAERPGEINEKCIATMLQAVREKFPERQIHFGIFPSEVRPEYIHPSILRAIKPLISNRTITIGVQSASQCVLDLAKRGHTIRNVEYALEDLRTEGFRIIMDFIFGLPGEDERAVKENIHFLKRWLSEDIRMRSHLFTPLPGTPFQHESPGRLHPQLRDFFQAYIPRKIITGCWE